MISVVKNTDIVKELFAGWEESCIWSCLQGVMGQIYSNDNKTAAIAVVGEFAFLAGRPDEEVVAFRPDSYKGDFVIMVPQNDAWNEVIEKAYEEHAKKVTRFAIKKEGDIFDRTKLRQVVDNLPKEYTLALIDETLFEECKKEMWSKYFVCNYESFAEFQEKNALGVVALKGTKMVAGASSYTSYHEGIEIEVDTKEDYRRRGLAYACCAKLVLECLERNLYPNWDAQNRMSVGVAEKLGYHFSHEYTAYEIDQYE